MNLEAFSFTCTESEAAAIYLRVKAAGFEANSQGVKAYLLASENGAGEFVEEDSGDLSQKVGRILEFAERNPEVTQAVIKKGSDLLATLFRKGKA